MPSAVGVAAHVGERDPRRLLHHVAELAGEHEALLAGHRGRLDEEHVAAGAGHREAGRHAGHGRALDRLLEEALAPEAVAHRRRASIVTGASTSPEASFVAVLRSSLPSSRSRLRTPASRVYSVTIVRRIVVGDLDLVRLAARCARAGAAAGSRARSRPSPRSCSRRSATTSMRSSSGAGNRLGHVRGGDEQHLGEVQLDVQVVVAEAVVLRRVEHLEQRRRGVAAPVRADLVDLVQQDHRVHRARRRAGRGRAGPAARRCRCGGGRGSRPRRARRPATCARTRGRSPARSTRRSRSCRCRAARSGSGSRPRPGPPRPCRARGAACARRCTR